MELAAEAIIGAALGLTSTIHCAGMCGAISCTLTAATSTGSPLATLVQLHGGRIAVYTMAGAAAGALGSPAVAWLDHSAAHTLLRWAATAMIIWSGLAVAGIVPAIAIADRALAFAAPDASRKLPRSMPPSIAAGICWGLTPCAMVVSALIPSSLTGNAFDGAVIMAAFGLSTLPAFVLTAMGQRTLSGFAANQSRRCAVGLTIAALGLLSLLVTAPVGAICASMVD